MATAVHACTYFKEFVGCVPVRKCATVTCTAWNLMPETVVVHVSAFLVLYLRFIDKGSALLFSLYGVSRSNGFMLVFASAFSSLCV